MQVGVGKSCGKFINNNPKEILIASELDKFNKERLLEKDVLDKILNSLADVANDPVLISGKIFMRG